MERDYRYTECGLDNVIIEGMAVIIDDHGEEVYCVPNVNELHKVIAGCIIASRHGLTPDQLRFLRTEMAVTQAELAKLVKKDHQTIGRWERGEKPIDQNAEAVIRIVAAERLGIRPDISFEELAGRCVPTAESSEIKIDGSDPNNYRPLAA